MVRNMIAVAVLVLAACAAAPTHPEWPARETPIFDAMSGGDQVWKIWDVSFDRGSDDAFIGVGPADGVWQSNVLVSKREVRRLAYTLGYQVGAERVIGTHFRSSVAFGDTNSARTLAAQEATRNLLRAAEAAYNCEE